MISADLTGKTALVTGGASGIGLATVESFARCGATVALNHLADDPRGGQQVERLKGLGHKIIAAPGNVSQPGEAEAMVTRAIDTLGGSISWSTTPAPRPPRRRSRLPIWTG
jgi:3-oxoacyl-[acyl-carrier protein] reductase